MIIDGRSRAQAILAGVKGAVIESGRAPVLCAIAVAPNAATASYLRIKSKQAADAGMTLEIAELAQDANTEAVIAAVQYAASRCDAVIVQLPLPSGIDTKLVLDAIPANKDADVLSTAARAAFTAGVPSALVPPVAAAMADVLAYAGVRLEGKRAIVIGDGWLVGSPCGTWLRQHGAIVRTVTQADENLDLLMDADLVVSGAGKPRLVQPAMLTEEVILIDAGTSESDGAIVGDIDPACAELASVFTPVPGGVGPIAVACLFRNVLQLAS